MGAWANQRQPVPFWCRPSSDDYWLERIFLGRQPNEALSIAQSGGGLALHPHAPSRIPAAAAVGPRDHLKQVAVDLFEVDAAPAVMVVDLALLRLAGVGPV